MSGCEGISVQLPNMPSHDYHHYLPFAPFSSCTCRHPLIPLFLFPTWAILFGIKLFQFNPIFLRSHCLRAICVCFISLFFDTISKEWFLFSFFICCRKNQPNVYSYSLCWYCRVRTYVLPQPCPKFLLPWTMWNNVCTCLGGIEESYLSVKAEMT